MSAASVAEPVAAPASPTGLAQFCDQLSGPPQAWPELVSFFAAEHVTEVAPQALALAREIRRRHGAAVQGVLFYGSCLRRRTVEDSVLDFYVVVDSYQAAYKRNIKGGLLALSNWLLPPNVYYVETLWQGQRLRMKYNIVSQRDFSRACRYSSLHAIIWARFCQPAALAWARDGAARERIAGDAAEAALTMVGRMLALYPQITDVEALWQFGFAHTYGTELRPETDDTIESIFRAAPQRYFKVTQLAVSELARRGLLEGCVRQSPSDGAPRDGGPQAGASAVIQVHMEDARRRAIARRSSWTGALAKSVYLVRLLKSALTFGDWLPYVIWKLGRHTGVYIEVTERQRRHPLVWGWPVLFRLLRRQTLR